MIALRLGPWPYAFTSSPTVAVLQSNPLSLKWTVRLNYMKWYFGIHPAPLLKAAAVTADGPLVAIQNLTITD